MPITNTQTKLARLLTSLIRSKSSQTGATAIASALETKGRLRRWSARNTVPGLLALAATESILVEGISWPAVALSGLAILPLCVSLFLQKKRPENLDSPAL